MQKELAPGTILIKAGTALPEGLGLSTHSYVPGWLLVRNPDSYGLGRAILEAGWTFFCLTSAIPASAFGFDANKTERIAVTRILARARLKNSNSMEIVRITARRFLGLSYTTVYGRSRHIQQGILLFRDEDDRRWAQEGTPKEAKTRVARTMGSESRSEGSSRLPDAAASSNLQLSERDGK
jgi:hypothetical protein